MNMKNILLEMKHLLIDIPVDFATRIRPISHKWSELLEEMLDNPTTKFVYIPTMNDEYNFDENVVHINGIPIWTGNIMGAYGTISPEYSSSVDMRHMRNTNGTPTLRVRKKLKKMVDRFHSNTTLQNEHDSYDLIMKSIVHEYFKNRFKQTYNL